MTQKNPIDLSTTPTRKAKKCNTSSAVSILVLLPIVYIYILFHIYIMTQKNPIDLSTSTPTKAMDLTKDAPYDSSSISSVVRNTFKIDDLKKQLKNVFDTSKKEPNKIVIDKFNVDICQEKLACLKSGQCLNDEVINFFGYMLNEYDIRMCEGNPDRKRIYFTTSGFMKKIFTEPGKYVYANVQRWTKKIETIFDLEKIIMPIHNEFHWTLAIVFVQNRQVIYFDSMGKGDEGPIYLDVIRKWLLDESKISEFHKIANDFVEADWKFKVSENTPQQMNGIDCGLFVLKLMDIFMRDDVDLIFSQDDVEINFTQADINDAFRVKIGTDIIRGYLDYPLSYLCDYYRNLYVKKYTKYYDPTKNYKNIMEQFNVIYSKTLLAKPKQKSKLQKNKNCESKYAKIPTIKMLLQKTSKELITFSIDEDSWYKSLSNKIYGNPVFAKSIRSILIWFFIMLNDQFIEIFGQEKLTVRTDLLKFLNSIREQSSNSKYKVRTDILNSLNLKDLIKESLDILCDDKQYNRFSWIDLLILSIIYPDKRFCILKFSNDNMQHLEAVIGEKSDNYIFCTKNIPDFVHDLFSHIYTGKELVQHLNSRCSSSSSSKKASRSSSTFNFKEVENICFIVHCVDHCMCIDDILENDSDGTIINSSSSSSSSSSITFSSVITED